MPPPALTVIDDRPLSADRVPTLTEVVELDLPAKAAPVAEDSVDAIDAEVVAVAPPLEVEHGTAAPAHPIETTEEVAEGPGLPEAHEIDLADTPALPAQQADPAIDGMPAAAAVWPAEAGTSADTSDEAPELSADDAAADVDDASERAVLAESTAPQPEPGVPVAALPVDVDAIVGQVLAELMPRIDMLLESRVREALAPALARAADGLIRDTRSELAVAMRDLVQEAADRVVQRRAER